MSNEHREEIIEYLLMWTIWSRDGLEKLDDRALVDEYNRYLGMG